MLRIFMAMMVMLPPSVSLGAEDGAQATMYRRPYCSCCDGHAEHLRKNGYKVTVVESDDLAAVKKQSGVPQAFEGCHTILVGGYVVEGHVPATIIDKLLKERPRIRGISLPGMPDGSPGMSGEKSAPFVVYELSGKVFATE